MDSESQGEDLMPPFFVGYHETERKLPITSQVLEQALNCNVRLMSETCFLTNDPTVSHANYANHE